MSLSVPMKITCLSNNQAEVEIGGVRRSVRLDLIDRPVCVDNYVIVHAGYAIHVINEAEAKETLKYFEEILTKDAQTSERIPE